MTDTGLIRPRSASLLGRLSAFIYGIGSYLLFLATFLYFILFVGDLLVPKSVNAGGPFVTSYPLALDLLLIALFGIQHSMMARRSFKRAWTRIVPVQVERSTYVLCATAVLVALLYFWQPMPELIWRVENPFAAGLLWLLFGLGWAVLFASTFMTDHFDLFGLRQVWLCLMDKPYAPVDFKARGLYRHMRHPLYSGFLLAFWATPEMTVGRLVLAIGFSVYIVIGTVFEERDLLVAFGDRYRGYCAALPRYIPRLKPHRD